MRTLNKRYFPLTAILAIMMSLIMSTNLSGQNIRFGIFADPAITWFSTDTKETRNDGARAGFNFGFTFNKYFTKNYSFSTGISILSSGGRLYNTEAINMSFDNFDQSVDSGNSVVYRVQYLNIPLGLKFESNQIGYITFFTDIGIDPKIVIGGKADIPSEGIKKEAAGKELTDFNLSYHIMAGIEYSLGGTTSMVFGIGFEKNFLDITRDINLQPVDRVTQNIIKFRIGVNF